jgi:hypothetical protein
MERQAKRVGAGVGESISFEAALADFIVQVQSPRSTRTPLAGTTVSRLSQHRDKGHGPGGPAKRAEVAAAPKAPVKTLCLLGNTTSPTYQRRTGLYDSKTAAVPHAAR